MIEQRRGIGLDECVQPHEREARARQPLGSDVLELRARDGDEEDRTATEVEQVIEEVHEHQLGPLKVIHDEHERAFGRKQFQEPADAPGDLFAWDWIIGQTHAMDSSAMAGRRSSASSAARRAFEARWSRDLNVPTATSRTAAASASGSPR